MTATLTPETTVADLVEPRRATGPAAVPTKRPGASWPLWGAAAGVFGIVGTLLSDTRPPMEDNPVTADQVFDLSPTGFHLGIAAGLIAESDVTPIGAVINGDHPGRTSDDQITLFDGTGVGLQDLAVAARAVELARDRGVAIEVEV